MPGMQQDDLERTVDNWALAAAVIITHLADFIEVSCMIKMGVGGNVAKQSGVLGNRELLTLKLRLQIVD